MRIILHKSTLLSYFPGLMEAFRSFRAVYPSGRATASVMRDPLSPTAVDLASSRWRNLINLLCFRGDLLAIEDWDFVASECLIAMATLRSGLCDGTQRAGGHAAQEVERVGW